MIFIKKDNVFLNDDKEGYFFIFEGIRFQNLLPLSYFDFLPDCERNLCLK